jgi:hypothetical protein
MTADEVPYDAFLSYSSKDGRAVARIQRFLERFRQGTPRRRVRVFLDRTDIRGGELGGEIGSALQRSRALVVCWSSAAADSRWVEREIALYRELHGDKNIALVLLGEHRAELGLPAGGDAQWRVHDLRGGWWLGLMRPHARLELLRLLAFLTGVELRTLRDWHLRRALRNAGIGTVAAIVPVAALLSLPIAGWLPLALRTDRGEPLYAVAAEARDGKLWVASRFRAPGPQGFRNYLRVTDDALDPHARAAYLPEPKLALRHRLVPPPLLHHSIASRLPPRDALAATTRSRVGLPFAGEPRPGHLVLVQPLGLTPEELDAAREHAADFDTPVFKSAAALVVVADDTGVRAVEVPDMVPEWTARTPTGDPTSPAKGIAVAWAGDGQIWLGVAGQDGRPSGGLWHSPDAGRTWRREDGFWSVSSLAVRESDGKPAELLAAESAFERWRNSTLEPYPSQVVQRTLPDGPWRDAPMPPFGTRSEVEFCGALAGAPVVRVDTTVFQYRPRPLLRVLVGD